MIIIDVHMERQNTNEKINKRKTGDAASQLFELGNAAPIHTA